MTDSQRSVTKKKRLKQKECNTKNRLFIIIDTVPAGAECLSWSFPSFLNSSYSDSGKVKGSIFSSGSHTACGRGASGGLCLLLEDGCGALVLLVAS